MKIKFLSWELETKRPFEEKYNFFQRQSSIAMILPYLQVKPLVNLALTNKTCNKEFKNHRNKPYIFPLLTSLGSENIKRQQDNIRWLDKVTRNTEANYIQESHWDKCSTLGHASAIVCAEAGAAGVAYGGWLICGEAAGSSCLVGCGITCGAACTWAVAAGLAGCGIASLFGAFCCPDNDDEEGCTTPRRVTIIFNPAYYQEIERRFPGTEDLILEDPRQEALEPKLRNLRIAAEERLKVSMESFKGAFPVLFQEEKRSTQLDNTQSPVQENKR